MEEDKNLEQNLDKSNGKLHISDVSGSTPITYKNRKCFYNKNDITPSSLQIPLYLDKDLTIPFIQKHKLIPNGVQVYLSRYDW